MSFVPFLDDENNYWRDEHILQMMVGEEVLSLLINQEDNTVKFFFKEVTVTLYHSQVCCENVVIDDVNGDVSDICGQILEVAEVRTSEIDDTTAEQPKKSVCDDYNTWTFYTFRTIKGSLDIKFHGSSNGYYSERVDVSIEKN